MQACGRLVARIGEQDFDRDIAAGIEIDGGDMAPVMGDLDDPAINDRYAAARQIGLDWGGFGYELACSALGQLPTHSGHLIRPQSVCALKPASIAGRRYPPSRPATMPG